MAEFAARLDQLSAVLDHVERRCEVLGATHDTALRAVLIVEELFVNAVKHGRAPDDSCVRVQLASQNGELELCFEDAGVAFDPFSHLSSATHHRPVGERPVGGLGVVLIDGFSLRHDYARVESRNRARIWLAARPA
jgi:serine/threonine-protein kinase RsbW